MRQLIFVVGWNTDEAAYAKLQEDIRKFWMTRLPTTLHYKWVHSRWDKSPPTMLDGDTVVGHSYGGWKAVEWLAASGSKCNLMLLDPTNRDKNEKRNDSDFILPSNVTNAICYFRYATDWPWSAPIRGAACEYMNYKYNAPQNTRAEVDAAHGKMVWDNRVIQAVSKWLL